MSSFIKKLSRFSKKEIDAAFAVATVAIKQPQITILRAPRQQTFGRILIITPKIVGCAPVRNKLRRRVKAIFYENKRFESAYDWIVIAKRGGGELEYDYLKALLLKTLQLP